MAIREMVECDVCGKAEEARKSGNRMKSPYPTGWRRTTTHTSGLKDSYGAVWTCSIKCAQDWLAEKG